MEYRTILFAPDKPGTPEEIVDDLIHFGVKGMHWGVRKEESLPSSNESGPQGLEHYSKAQAASMKTVSEKMEKEYGFKVDEFTLFTKSGLGNPNSHFSDNENKRYLAMVAPKKKGDTRNVIHVANDRDYKVTLDKAEKMGWFPPSGGKSLEANISHEAAHGLFHSNDSSGKGVLKEKDTLIAPLRGRAWESARNQAVKDGHIVSPKLSLTAHYEMVSKISGYSNSSQFIHEHEAELFSAYHWSPNPPKFVDAFMNDIHRSMGKQVRPFSGRKVSHAS